MRMTNDVGNAVIHARVIQQGFVIDLVKSLERMRTFATACRPKCTSNEQRCTLTHHPADLFFGQDLPTELFDQLIC
jgi:hypothetical protein